MKPSIAELFRKHGIEAGSRGVGNLLQRLQAYRVDWKFSFVPTENVEYEPGIDRGPVNLDDPEANVISSEIKAITWDGVEGDRKHVVALDIDHRAWLVPSSTEGHSHLYIDKAIPHEDYMDLLRALAKCGII